MKPILLILIFLIPTILKSQEQNTTESTNKYLEKSIKQRKTGKIIAMTGGGLFVTGLIVAGTDPHKNEWLPAQSLAGMGISTIGVLTVLASVPFYISSNSNKKKSARISPQTGSITFEQKSYVTAGIK